MQIMEIFLQLHDELSPTLFRIRLLRFDDATFSRNTPSLSLPFTLFLHHLAICLHYLLHFNPFLHAISSSSLTIPHFHPCQPNQVQLILAPTFERVPWPKNLITICMSRTLAPQNASSSRKESHRPGSRISLLCFMDTRGDPARQHAIKLLVHNHSN